MKTKFPLIVGNWKMHKTAHETALHINRLRTYSLPEKTGVWLAVPFTSIAPAKEAAAGTDIEIGAQNMADLLEGALTGEVSAPMIIEAGAQFVILGHSERRKFFFESDALINRKVKLALQVKLKVILCIGETKEERESGQTENVLIRQLTQGLKNVLALDASKVVVAYEPVWAIGSKNAASLEIVEEIHSLCKNHLANYWGARPADCRILYGGSVNEKNARAFLELPAVDGLLVGAASLDVQSFVEIIQS